MIVRTEARAPVMYHGCTRVTSTGVCEHRGHILTVYTIYLRAKIGVIHSTADAYAIGLFIDLRSDSVCMHSGSYFLNPREFVLNIFLPFVAYNVFSQVCFVHNFFQFNRYSESTMTRINHFSSSNE
jgi:hypothetical protein